MSDLIPAVPAWYHVSWGADLRAVADNAPMGRVVAHVCVRFPQLPPPANVASSAKLTGRISLPGLGQQLQLLDGTLTTTPGTHLGLAVEMHFADERNARWRLTLRPLSDPPANPRAADEPAELALFAEGSQTATATGQTTLYLRLFLSRIQAG